MLIRTRHFFQQHILKSLYYAFINSHLTYCISSWGNTYPTHLTSLNHLQNRAVRIIAHSSFTASAPPIFRTLEILPLTCTFQLKLGLLLFRSRNCDIPTELLPPTLLYNTNNTRFSENNNLLLPKVNTNYGKMTAFFSAISFWNSLPSNIKSSPSLHCFRRLLKQFLLTTYVN